MTVTSVHYVTGQQCHLSTGGDVKVRRGATMWRLRGVQLVELRCYWLFEGVISYVRWIGIWYTAV